MKSYTSHILSKTIALLKVNKNVLSSLSVHSSYIFLPFDVCVFGPLKEIVRYLLGLGTIITTTDDRKDIFTVF